MMDTDRVDKVKAIIQELKELLPLCEMDEVKKEIQYLINSYEEELQDTYFIETHGIAAYNGVPNKP